MKKVVADEKPLTEAESYFADAKFYLRREKKDKPTKQDASKSKSPIWHYVPKTKEKEEKQPLIEDNKLKGLTVPLTSIDAVKAKKPLKGFVRPKMEPNVEQDSLPTSRTEEGFDPNAYKLLVKAGYNPKEENTLGKLLPEITGEKTHGMTSTQKMLRNEGHTVKSSSRGLGYTPPSPVRITIKRASTHYINSELTPRRSVFERLERYP